MSTVTFTIRDRSDELSTVTIPMDDVDDQSWVATDAEVTAIQTAIAALTTGNIARRQLTAYSVPVNDARPANPYAQRETGLRLFYQDDVNAKKGYITIPAPDLTLVGSGGTDDVDLSGISVVNALVTLLETSMRSPYGNSVTFYRGTIVGRRS